MAAAAAAAAAEAQQKSKRARTAGATAPMDVVPATPRAALPGTRAPASARANPSPHIGARYATAAPAMLLPYSLKFAERDDYGTALGEAELRRIEEGSAALTAMEVVSGSIDDAPSAGGGRGTARLGLERAHGARGAKAADDDAAAEEDDEENDEDDDDAAELGAASGNVEDAAADAPPSKWVSRRVNVAVRCQVRMVGMEGRSDGRSIKAILTQVEPHTLVLVNGDAASTDHLAEHCREGAAAGQRVVAPEAGERVDGSSNSSAYTIKLSDAMLSQVAPRKIGGYEIARVSGVLDIPRPAATTTPGAATSGSGAPPPPAAPPLRAGLSGVLEPRRERRSGSVDFVSQGEVRLADLKQLLTRAGHHAEFAAGGALVINSSVCVRKDGNSRLLLEGAYGEDYLRVRGLLFDQMEGT